jgi:hypothetical protein
MFASFVANRIYSSGQDHDHVLFDESMDAKALPPPTLALLATA